MATPTEELASLAKKAIDDVKELSSSVAKSLDQIDKIRDDYKSGKWSKFVQLIKIISPVIIFFSGIFFAQHIPCGTIIGFAGIEISRNCSMNSI